MIPSVLPTYNRAALTFVKGEGSWLIEKDGRRFLDLGAGIAVNALGHAHPALVKALTDQGQALWHTSNLYQIPQQQALADKLVEIHLPIRSFSPIPAPRPASWRSRWRASTSMTRASPSGSRS